MRSFRKLLPLLCLLAVAVPAPAHAALDVRQTLHRVTAPVSAVVTGARTALERTLGPQGLVQIDPLTGTPRVIADLDGFLSGPQTGPPTVIAKRWVRQHRLAMGLTGRDLAANRLKLIRNATAPDGATTMIWAQTYKGIPSLDTTLRATVTRDGRVLSVGGSPLHAMRAPVHPLLTAIDALQKVLDATKTRGAATLTGGNQARLILVNMGNQVRLGWQVWLDAAPDKVWDVIVDARSGRVLRRVNRVLHAGVVKAWDNFPGAAKGGNQADHDMSKYLTAPDRLEGNYTHVFTDVADDDTPADSDEVRPNANGDWVQPYTSVFSPLGNCPAAGCSWNHLLPNSWQTNLAQNAQQVFYFVNTFADYLKQAPIGFDEASGNFQTSNGDKGGKGNDPVLANATDGAATAVVLPNPLTNALNANMLTPADGESPRMQMYLFEPLPLLAPDFADVNGGDDASIVYHEYTHGLTNRLVIGGDGDGALISDQAGAMGEAWSDFYAMDYLVRHGFLTDTDAPGELNEGGFTDNDTHNIRSEAIDCPVGADATACPRAFTDPVPGTGGYTYEAFGKIFGSPEPHADGEIWGQTLWDLRQALIAAHGTDEGGKRVLQLVTGALRVSPEEPSFLDMRNAILEADTIAGGADHDLIWSVFAKRGMGYDAQAADGFDDTPVAGFKLPPAADGPKGNVSGTVTNADGGGALTGVPAGISAFFSGLDGDYRAISGTDGKWTIKDVPAGTYGAVRVGGLGFEPVTLGKVTVAGGDTKGGFDAKLLRNWGMFDGGAKLVARTGKDVGCGPGGALDANPGTGWETYSDTSSVDPGPKTFEIKLPAPIDITRLMVDPRQNCFDDATSALRGYKVEFSRNGTEWTTASEGEFGMADMAPTDLAVQGNASNVQFVRMTMKNNQGLLADPTSTAPTYTDFMDMTELGLYGTSADKEAPTIHLDVVDRGAVRGPTATIKGSVTDNYTVARVNVNGSPARLADDGTFSLAVPVARGENKLDVEAFDGSQNRAEASVTVLGDYDKPVLRKVRAKRLPIGAIRVRGLASDDTKIRLVRVHGKRATLVGAKFERQFKAKPKVKTIKVVAKDLANRRTVVRVKVRR